MSRLFEDAGKGKQNRRWQCFVCGRQHLEYEEYKNHIRTEHEEGREYIICPADFCGAPVRDLKSHWKVKHPNRMFPKNVQTKVTVWNDFDAKGKKKKTKKPNFRKGGYYSKKNNKDLYYRSGLEADFYECLEHDMDVIKYEAESLKVPYYWNNKWKTYIPDLLIEFADGSKEVWEIKPSQQLEYQQNQAKWTSATNYFNNFGIKFVVQNESVLEKYQLKIKRQGV